MAYKYQSLQKKEIGTSLSEINVTPLVDVMLVLLIIFMVTAPMIQSGIGINLPEAETESSPADEGLTLTIDADRYIYIKDSPINQLLLEQKLKEYSYGKDNPVVFLRADQSLPYGYIIEIMDIINKAGITNLGLMSQPPPKKRR